MRVDPAFRDDRILARGVGPTRPASRKSRPVSTGRVACPHELGIERFTRRGFTNEETTEHKRQEQLVDHWKQEQIETTVKRPRVYVQM